MGPKRDGPCSRGIIGGSGKRKKRTSKILQFCGGPQGGGRCRRASEDIAEGEWERRVKRKKIEGGLFEKGRLRAQNLFERRMISPMPGPETAFSASKIGLA